LERDKRERKAKEKKLLVLLSEQVHTSYSEMILLTSWQLSWDALLITDLSTILDGCGVGAQQLRIRRDIATVNEWVVLTVKTFDVTELRTGFDRW
jgi:hypothetical protein